MGTFKEKESGAQVIEIDIDDVIPDPNQPRKEFDKAGLKVLSGAVKTHGQINPILVRPKNSNGKYMIVDGERRWRSALANQRVKILAQIRELDEDEILVIQLFANIGGGIREGLSVRERAEALKSVIAKHGTQEKAAEALGLTQPWISANIAILGLTPEIEQLRTDGQIKDNKVLVHLQRLQGTDKTAADALIERARSGAKIPRHEINDALTAAGVVKRRKKNAEGNISDAPLPKDAVPAHPIVPVQSEMPTEPEKSRKFNPSKVKKVAKALGVSDDIDPDDLLNILMDKYLDMP